MARKSLLKTVPAIAAAAIGGLLRGGKAIEGGTGKVRVSSDLPKVQSKRQRDIPSKGVPIRNMIGMPMPDLSLMTTGPARSPIPSYRGETGVAKARRAARKRRNVRARSPKK